MLTRENIYKSLARKYDNKFETGVTRSHRDDRKVELYIYIIFITNYK